MQAPQEVQKLVEKFQTEESRFRDPNYNETQVRIEFIDPLFTALGWDMRDSRTVIHEDRVKVTEDSGKKASKHPDYGFRVAGEIRPRFYVEAKKPAVNIAKDPEPAYQVRRYGWSAGMPLCILTDFEEFSIYDCRVKPEKTDSAKKALRQHIKYSDYLERWDELYELLNPDAVLEGSLNKYIDDKSASGTLRVDEAFLQEMEGWRTTLAKEIALHNPNLTRRELNIAVQRTIDRIVFLRICEARKIEPDGRMRSSTANRKDIYEELKILYREADDKYNSGLFNFAKDGDTISLAITISDEPLQHIIRRLYYPESPYEFSVLPADILGQVYERFLGKVIELSDGGIAKIEEKPEVRKAGGVYYTPTYIVDYIVENTVGKLLNPQNPPSQSLPEASGGDFNGIEETDAPLHVPTDDALTPNPSPDSLRRRGALMTPADVSKIKILDPACGSGSFLIGAYQFLLDWHLAYYTERLAENPNSTFKNRVRETKDPVQPFALTTDEKKRILINNIYGVDLDQQAVEVSKLSLLLKMLEEESAETTQFSLFATDERILPDLSSNIKWGNSLIESDFYSGKQLPMFDAEEIYRVKAFDWDSEFADIMKAGGFNAVIGNPPYVRQETLGQDFKKYAKKIYETYAGTADLYAYFIEKGVKLLRKDGMYGVIVANKWMRANYGKALRGWMAKQNIIEITDFKDLPVFQDATTYPCILIIGEGEISQTFDATLIDSLDFASLTDYVQENNYTVNQTLLDESEWSLAEETTQALLEKLNSKGLPLSEYVHEKIYIGVKTGFNKAFIIDTETRDKLIDEHPSSSKLIKPYLVGRDIKRFSIPNGDRYLIFTGRNQKIEEYPAIQNHLAQYRERLEPKPRDWSDTKWNGRKAGSYTWYETQDPVAYHPEFEKPKIVYSEIAMRGQFTLDSSGFYCDMTAYIICSESKYLLGILNSKLMTFIFSNISSEIRGGYLRWKRQYIKQLPIRTIDFDNPAEKAQHDKMVGYVEEMLALHKQLAEAQGEAQKGVIQNLIERKDKAIDKLVYELYGLSDEEIKIVEGE